MLTAFIISSLFLAISPGPDNLYLITISVSKGRENGFYFLLGLILGCLTHTLMLAYGLTPIFLNYDVFFELIKYVGFFYITYLVYNLFVDKKNNQNETDLKENIGDFKKGFFMNILNPKVFIFYLVFFPNFLFSNTLNFTHQILTIQNFKISKTNPVLDHEANLWGGSWDPWDALGTGFGAPRLCWEHLWAS